MVSVQTNACYDDIHNGSQSMLVVFQNFQARTDGRIFRTDHVKMKFWTERNSG